jgi:cytochrome oxidase Cu insertion factor (SCO1/SenC/PrrC family)
MLQGLLSVIRVAAFLCFALAHLNAAQLPRATGTASNPLAPPASRPPYEDRFIAQPVPDITVLTASGPLLLSRLWQEKPLVVTMVYTRCRGVCVPYLRFLRDAANSDGGAGRDYRILVLSFDPQDTVADMKSVAGELGLQSNSAWIFGVAGPHDMRQLTSAMGYWFRWEPSSNEYDHPALLAGIKDGRLLRLLAGMDIPSARFREVTNELRGRFVRAYPLPSNIARFRCFQYDANGSLYLDWGALLMFIPATFAIACTACIFGLSRRCRRGTRFAAPN